LFFRSKAAETTLATQAKPEMGVVSAIKQAAKKTGVSFDYLLNTATAESSLRPEAKASTSSASGLFQFIESTWLELIGREGAKVGMSEAASQVTFDAQGRPRVQDPAVRRSLLAMRHDPEASALMAGVFTQKNVQSLRDGLDRDPTAGELYMAHFLGAQGAVNFIQAAEQSPKSSAAAQFPEQAEANRPIFFDKKGRARSLGEVYQVLASKGEPMAIASVQRAVASQEPSIDARSFDTRLGDRFAFKASKQPLHNLYQSQGAGAINPRVAALWSADNQTGSPDKGTGPLDLLRFRRVRSGVSA
jgi:hypothetical protein